MVGQLLKHRVYKKDVYQENFMDLPRIHTICEFYGNFYVD